MKVFPPPLIITPCGKLALAARGIERAAAKTRNKHNVAFMSYEIYFFRRSMSRAMAANSAVANYFTINSLTAKT
jgi:hypothetical protein